MGESMKGPGIEERIGVGTETRREQTSGCNKAERDDEVIECDTTKLRLLNDSRRLMAPAAARADSRAVPVECRRPEMLDLTSEPFHAPLTFGSPSAHLRLIFFALNYRVRNTFGKLR
jgi:hypothetical protein